MKSSEQTKNTSYNKKTTSPPTRPARPSFQASASTARARSKTTTPSLNNDNTQRQRSFSHRTVTPNRSLPLTHLQKQKPELLTVNQKIKLFSTDQNQPQPKTEPLPRKLGWKQRQKPELPSSKQSPILQPKELPQQANIELIGIVQYLSEFYETLFKIFQQPIGKDNIKGIAGFLTTQLLSKQQRSVHDALICLFTPMLHIFTELEKLKQSGNYNALFVNQYKELQPTMSTEQAEQIISQLNNLIRSREIFFKKIIPSSLALQIISNSSVSPEYSLQDKLDNDLLFNGCDEDIKCFDLTGSNNMQGYLQGVFSKVAQFLPFLSTRVTSLFKELSKDSTVDQDTQSKVQLVMNELKTMLTLGNRYCGDVIQIIDEEKSIEVILPEKNKYRVSLNSWQEQAKTNDILFIFNPGKSQWLAVLSKSCQLKKKDIEFETKEIINTSAFHNELEQNKHDLNKAKQQVKSLLRSERLFDDYTPVISEEASKRHSMAIWQTGLSPQTTTSSPTSVKRNNSMIRKNTLTRKNSLTKVFPSFFAAKEMTEQTVMIRGARVLQLMLRSFEGHIADIENNNSCNNMSLK